MSAEDIRLRKREKGDRKITREQRRETQRERQEREADSRLERLRQPERRFS